MSRFSKYCISVSNRNNLDEIFKNIPSNSFIEYRLDVHFSLSEIKKIIENYLAIITLKVFDEKYYENLFQIIDLLPEFIDIDFNYSQNYLNEILNYTREKNVKSILSYHCEHEFYEQKQIKDLIKKMLSFSPDIVKFVFKLKNSSSSDTLMNLYGEIPKEKIILFGVGENFKHTRIEALKRGAPFMYFYHPSLGKTAEGQFSIDEIVNLKV